MEAVLWWRLWKLCKMEIVRVEMMLLKYNRCLEAEERADMEPLAVLGFLENTLYLISSVLKMLAMNN